MTFRLTSAGTTSPPTIGDEAEAVVPALAPLRLALQPHDLVEPARAHVVALPVAELHRVDDAAELPLEPAAVGVSGRRRAFRCGGSLPPFPGATGAHLLPAGRPRQGPCARAPPRARRAGAARSSRGERVGGAPAARHREHGTPVRDALRSVGPRDLAAVEQHRHRRPPARDRARDARDPRRLVAPARPGHEQEVRVVGLGRRSVVGRRLARQRRERARRSRPRAARSAPARACAWPSSRITPASVPPSTIAAPVATAAATSSSAQAAHSSTSCSLSPLAPPTTTQHGPPRLEPERLGARPGGSPHGRARRRPAAAPAPIVLRCDSRNVRRGGRLCPRPRPSYDRRAMPADHDRRREDRQGDRQGRAGNGRRGDGRRSRRDRGVLRLSGRRRRADRGRGAGRRARVRAAEDGRRHPAPEGEKGAVACGSTRWRSRTRR